jgi:hypothetical protein
MQGNNEVSEVLKKMKKELYKIHVKTSIFAVNKKERK